MKNKKYLTLGTFICFVGFNAINYLFHRNQSNYDWFYGTLFIEIITSLLIGLIILMIKNLYDKIKNKKINSSNKTMFTLGIVFLVFSLFIVFFGTIVGMLFV